MGSIVNNGNTTSISNNRIVTITFTHSKSKLLKRAINIAKTFPFFEEQKESICCAIDNMYDFCRLQRSVKELIQIVSKWKTSKICLYNNIYKTPNDYYVFLDQVKIQAGKYAVLIDRAKSNVSLGQVSIENLPYPIVYYPRLYGAFFAFSKEIDGPIVFCECERKPIENYIKFHNKKTRLSYNNGVANPLGTDCFPEIVSQLSVGLDNPLSPFSFKPGLCFRCNKVVPNYTYCHPMYGGSFKQHYGWYIEQEYYRLGIDRRRFVVDMNMLEDTYDPDIYDSLKRLSILQKTEYTERNTEDIDEINQLQAQIAEIVENSVRAQFGYRKKGDTWISETILYNIVCELFKDTDIKRHYRPSWLGGLELDIFVPDHKLAFEYQGIQHFCAVKHWGGEKQLQKQKEHDARKKQICLERGINLICINYNDPLTTDYVVGCIKSE